MHLRAHGGMGKWNHKASVALKYRPDIDGLRAVAVLPVVLYHAGWSAASGGFVGVDVFFVISGFLITSIVSREIEEGRFSLISFYERRARRILPALMAVVIVSFAIGWFVLLPQEMAGLGQSALSAALFVSNFYFAKHFDYFTPGAEFAPLLHTWSLAVEEQFYLFFPPLLMLLAWTRLKRPLLIIAGLSLSSLLAAAAILPLEPDWVFYLIIFRAWELGAGAMLALVPLKRVTGRPAQEVLALSGLSAILIPVFIFDAATPFPALAALPPVIGASILIWIGAHGRQNIVSRALEHRALVWVGLTSYSLYLWHWPILSFLRISLNTAVLPAAVAIAAVAMSVAMAWMSFRFVERPFRLTPPQGFRRRTVFTASAVSLASVVGAGWILHATNGLPTRLTAEATEFAAIAQDWDGRGTSCFGLSPTEGLCSIGAPPHVDGQIEFLFWGDSHVAAIMPGMDMASKAAGRAGIFSVQRGCPPILEIEGLPEPGCAEFNRKVELWLEGRPDVSLVILGARWPYYVEGTPYKLEGGSAFDIQLRGSAGQLSSDSNNPSLVLDGLNATVTQIVATGRRVVLVGPIPEVGQDVPGSLARRALLGWSPVASLTRNDFETRTGRTERILRRVTELNEGVQYIPLSDLFCDEHRCRVTNDDKVPIYLDDDHVSQTAARSLLSERLREIWND